jgi:hypothetical protein
VGLLAVLSCTRRICDFGRPTEIKPSAFNLEVGGYVVSNT